MPMATAKVELYHGLPSTCSKKVRLVLYEKGIPFKSHLMDLRKFEQHAPDYLKLNPDGVVPTLVHDGDFAMAPFIDRTRDLRPAFLDRVDYPRLDDWYERLRERPAFAKAIDLVRDRTRAKRHKKL
jgi:glutathione S-transferase